MAQYRIDTNQYLSNGTTIFEVQMGADKDGNVLNTFGSGSNIPVSAGLVDGYSYVEKFGSNLTVGANLETIWDQGGLYTFLSNAAQVYVDTIAADDGEDNATGTGARTVTVEGLDSSYNPISETVTVGGAISTASFLRVFRAYVETAGSIGTNTKPILISTAANGTGTVLATIGTHGIGVNEEGFGQTQLGVYTIPAGKTGYLTQWTVGSSGTSAVQAFIRYREYVDGTVAKTLDNLYFVNGLQTKDYTIPLKLTEKSDIEIQAYNNATGIAVSTSFNIILIDNSV